MSKLEKAIENNPEANEEKIRYLYNEDPTKQKKYFPWMVSRLTKDQIHESRIIFAVQDFHEKVNSSLIKNKDINAYKKPEDILKMTIAKDSNSQKRKTIIQTTPKFKGKNYTYYKINNFSQMKYFGKNTRWCVTNKRTYEDYKRDQSFIVCIENKTKKKFCVHYYNSEKEISIIDERDIKSLSPSLVNDRDCYISARGQFGKTIINDDFHKALEEFYKEEFELARSVSSENYRDKKYKKFKDSYVKSVAVNARKTGDYDEYNKIIANAKSLKDLRGFENYYGDLSSINIHPSKDNIIDFVRLTSNSPLNLCNVIGSIPKKEVSSLLEMILNSKISQNRKNEVFIKFIETKDKSNFVASFIKGEAFANVYNKCYKSIVMLHILFLTSKINQIIQNKNITKAAKKYTVEALFFGMHVHARYGTMVIDGKKNVIKFCQEEMSKPKLTSYNDTVINNYLNVYSEEDLLNLLKKKKELMNKS